MFALPPAHYVTDRSRCPCHTTVWGLVSSCCVAMIMVISRKPGECYFIATATMQWPEIAITTARSCMFLVRCICLSVCRYLRILTWIQSEYGTSNFDPGYAFCKYYIVLCWVLPSLLRRTYCYGVNRVSLVCLFIEPKDSVVCTNH